LHVYLTDFSAFIVGITTAHPWELIITVTVSPAQVAELVSVTSKIR
jgi:hypothetical protein